MLDIRRYKDNKKKEKRMSNIVVNTDEKLVEKH